MGVIWSTLQEERPQGDHDLVGWAPRTERLRVFPDGDRGNEAGHPHLSGQHVAGWEFLQLKEDVTLYFIGHEVSYVYYMDGYVMPNYEPEYELSWKGRRLIEESNVIRTPGMPIEMVIQKRMQAELSKPEVMSKYLDSEEVTLLQSNIVPIH